MNQPTNASLMSCFGDVFATDCFSRAERFWCSRSSVFRSAAFRFAGRCPGSEGDVGKRTASQILGIKLILGGSGANFPARQQPRGYVGFGRHSRAEVGQTVQNASRIADQYGEFAWQNGDDVIAYCTCNALPFSGTGIPRPHLR